MTSSAYLKSYLILTFSPFIFMDFGFRQPICQLPSYSNLYFNSWFPYNHSLKYQSTIFFLFFPHISSPRHLNDLLPFVHPKLSLKRKLITIKKKIIVKIFLKTGFRCLCDQNWHSPSKGSGELDMLEILNV